MLPFPFTLTADGALALSFFVAIPLKISILILINMGLATAAVKSMSFFDKLPFRTQTPLPNALAALRIVGKPAARRSQRGSGAAKSEDGGRCRHLASIGRCALRGASTKGRGGSFGGDARGDSGRIGGAGGSPARTNGRRHSHGRVTPNIVASSRVLRLGHSGVAHVRRGVPIGTPVRGAGTGHGRRQGASLALRSRAHDQWLVRDHRTVMHAHRNPLP